MTAIAANRSPRTPATVPDDTIDVIRVDIGGIGFALPLGAVATILAPSAMVTRADDTGWAGVVRSRGGEIPIANGRSVFGLGEPGVGPGQLLILRGSPATGLLVDAIHGSSTIAAANTEWLSPLFGPVDRLLTQSISWHTDGMLDLIIDIPALRRHLHIGAAEISDSAAVSIAALFEHAPPGDRLEVRLDDSDRSWLLPIAYVRHISGPRPPARLPLANPAILGLLAWRREPIPLIDTSSIFGLASTNPTTLIVVGPPSQPDDALLALTLMAVTGVAAPGSDAAPLDLAEIVRRLG